MKQQLLSYFESGLIMAFPKYRIVILMFTAAMAVLLRTPSDSSSSAASTPFPSINDQN